jgi:hypothetical protein
MRIAQFLLSALAILLAIPILVLLADFLYYDNGVWALKVGPNGLRECVLFLFPAPPSPFSFSHSLSPDFGRSFWFSPKSGRGDVFIPAPRKIKGQT